jgi:tetratricopeptide (TPR) repeat protein
MRFRGRTLAGGLALALSASWLLLSGISCRGDAARTSPGITERSRAPVGKVTPVPTQEVGWLTIGLEDPPASSLMDVKPPDLPGHLKSLYRLRPDRRFLYAAAELDRLLQGSPRQGTMAVRFQDPSWVVELDASPIGSLPSLPTFADAKKFLASRIPPGKISSHSVASVSQATSSPDVFDSAEGRDLLAALARLNTGWTASPGDPAIAEQGLRGLLWLALQSYDELERSDPILGKAMALLTIAQAGRPDALSREECLLASLLGYEEEARALASALSAGEPIRLFAQRDYAGLAALAKKPHPDARAEYFYLLLLGDADVSEETWLARFHASSWEKRNNVPTLRLLLGSQSIEAAEPAHLMERQILEDFQPLAQSDPSADPSRTGDLPPEGQCVTLEAAVDKEAARLEGPIVDRAVVRAFYLGNFYSSFAVKARYFFDSFGSTDEAERYGKSILNPPPGTATELKDWILHRVHLRRSAEGARAVAEDLARLSHIGATPLNRIVYSVASSGIGYAVRRMFLPGLFGHLDSRPSNLDVAARTSRDLLNDLSLVEQFFREAVRRAPRQTSSDVPWALGFLGDDQGLRALARDRTWSSRIRVSALQQIERREKKGSKELVADYQALLRENPTGTGALRPLIELLETRNEIDPALRIVDSWLSHYPDRDLAWAGMTSVKSRLLRKQGRLQEAWKSAEAAARSWKWECMQEASLVLIELGRLDEALRMAENQLNRYGNDDDRSLVAQIFWMKGQDDEASQLVTSTQRRLSPGAWGTVLPRAFSSAFKKSDEARAEAAFLKLVEPSVPALNLVYFVEYLTNNDRADLALRLGEHLRGRGSPGWGTVVVYHAIRKARGKEAAREWLRANATPVDLDVIGKQSLLERDFDCVLDLPDHPDPTKNEILNLIRAAALVHSQNPDPARREQVIRFLESRPRSEFVTYGLFLLGRVDRAELFSKVKDIGNVTSVGWLVGLSAAQQGRYDEANSWLQVCQEAGADTPPRMWAGTILGSWAMAGGTLAEAASKKVY